MKTWILIVLSVMCFQQVFSQVSEPPYKRNKNLPSFEIQRVNNTVYKSSTLKKNLPVIIMFFSPGCDHCIHQFEDMQKRMNDLKTYQIVMATYQPLEELAEFEKKYQLSRYPNIVAGRDVNYFFPPFFNIRNFPYLAFYDKQGKLIDTFEGNLKIDDLLKKFK